MEFWAALFVLLYLGPLVYFLFGKHILSLFMPKTFEIVHTCISIYNANTYEMLNNSYKHFTFDSLISISHLSLLKHSMFEDVEHKCKVTVTNILHLAAIFILS